MFTFPHQTDIYLLEYQQYRRIFLILVCLIVPLAQLFHHAIKDSVYFKPPLIVWLYNSVVSQYLAAMPQSSPVIELFYCCILQLINR